MPTIEKMILKLVDVQGPVLTSRGRATVLRTSVECAAQDGQEVVVDLQDVLTMSPSFADEMFAKLSVELLDTGLVKIENVPPAVEPLLRFVIGGRRRAASA